MNGHNSGYGALLGVLVIGIALVFAYYMFMSLGGAPNGIVAVTRYREPVGF